MDFKVMVDGIPIKNGTGDWQCAYNNKGRMFYFRDAGGAWRKRDLILTRLTLRGHGLNGTARKGENLSEVDQAVKHILDHNEVDFAIPLAGYPEGRLDVGGHSLLITRSNPPLPAKEGDYPMLRKFLIDLLGEEPFQHHMGWWQWARKSLSGVPVLPGQAMIYVGPSGAGKSFIQKLTTRLLGGQQPGKPFAYMAGRTTFNSELFYASHLVIEDEFADMGAKGRREFGARLKELVVNEYVSCHGKGLEAVTLRPKWRVSMSMNNEEEHLQVLPPMEPSTLDKMMLFSCNKPEFPYDLSTTDGWEKWNKTVDDELPALAHAIDTFEIPKRMVETRYGVKAWHSKSIVNRESDNAPEEKLWHCIEHDLPLILDGKSYWEGRSLDLERELTRSSMPSSLQARALFSWPGACGTYLGRLLKNHGDRVSKRMVKGYNKFRIQF